MHKISEVIIVEGRYDKNTLSQIVDATIIETNGFGIFNDKEKQQLLKTIAEKRGIIVMTDPDGAGLVIRNFIKGSVDPKFVKHAYVPEILGKERRKNHASKEGKLGVEGMDAEAIIRALKCCGATIDDKKATAGESITMADLYAIGFTGRHDSAAKRAAFLSSMNFPSKMTAQTFLPLVNALMSRDEFLEQAF